MFDERTSAAAAAAENTARVRDGHGRSVRRLLTLGDVAAYLSVSQKTVRRLVAARKLPCIRLGRVLRFEAADIDRFLEARRG